MSLLNLISVLFIFTFSFHSSLAEDRRRDDYVRRNRRTVESIYDLVVYPNNVPILQGLSEAIPDQLFNDNVTGRVTPIGAFTGLNDSLEYFFVSSIPSPPSYIGFSKSDVVQFSSECPEVAASTVYLETTRFIPDQPQPAVSTLKEVAFWNFDESGAVINYDAWIPNLGSWVEVVTGVNPYAPEVQQGTISGICQTAVERCVGPNQQYESVEQCVQTLSAKPYGNFDDAWGDNVVCRSIHLLLTVTRPDIHCAHVGPTGGGKCVDKSYDEKYFGDVGIFGAPSSEIFKCPRRRR